MQKIILFYKFVPITDPKALMLWQQELATNLDLRGRIIIADQGINVTLGGEIDNLKKYIYRTKQFAPLKKLDIKWSSGTKNDFPRLSVKVRDEIVSFLEKKKISVEPKGIKGSGIPIKPEQISDLINKYGEDVVFFDGRNNYESAIGKFCGAITPNVNHSREYKSEIKKDQYNKLKDKHIVTYCTGGIRCEVLSTLMKQEGFKNVYQLKGGIIRYGEKYKDKGLWQGKLFVFDKRMKTQFSKEAIDIGQCHVCQNKTSDYTNCKEVSCNKLILLCKLCQTKKHLYCSPHHSIQSV